MILHLNGRFLERDEAGLDPLERGYLLGEGIFETIRAEEGHPLHFSAHEARLRDGLRVLDIPFGMTGTELLGICQQVLDANALRCARLRVTVSAGAGDGTPEGEASGAATLLVHATSLDSELCLSLPPPIALGTTIFMLNPFSPLARIKSTCYAERMHARRRAIRNGADDALMFNLDRRVAGASTANLFAVTSDGVLTTPPIAAGALPGIIRAEILRLAAGLGLHIDEGTFGLTELENAKEVFLTNAIRQIRPVQGIVRHSFYPDAPGPITRALHAAYRESIAAYLADVRTS